MWKKTVAIATKLIDTENSLVAVRGGGLGGWEK